MRNRYLLKINPLIYKTGSVLSVLTLFFCFMISYANAAKLLTPTIVINPDIYYPLDEVLYIEGRANPDSSIEVLLHKSGSKPVRAVAKSDSYGEWVFAQKLPLDAGNWEIRARIIDGGNVSEWSNPRIIKVIITGIVLGGVAIKFSLLLFVIVALLVIGVFGVIYYSRRVKAVAAKYETALHEKEREALRTKIEQEFYEIHEKILHELEFVEKRVEDNKLTDEEKKEILEHRDELFRELKEKERILEKSIKNMP